MAVVAKEFNLSIGLRFGAAKGTSGESNWS